MSPDLASRSNGCRMDSAELTLTSSPVKDAAHVNKNRFSRRKLSKTYPVKQLYIHLRKQLKMPIFALVKNGALSESTASEPEAVNSEITTL